jgi:hypothetical protein
VADPADSISIFVLPFRNPTPYLHRPTTEETANEICARMTDALIDSLAGIDGVRVGPRKSGWIFEPEETLRRRAAQAPYRMEHAICGHLEITNAWISGRVELYETGPDRVLWSTNFVGTTNEVVALEGSIIEGLALTLGSGSELLTGWRGPRSSWANLARRSRPLASSDRWSPYPSC